MFWLPYYLTNKFHWAQDVADEISVWYDVGGIVGTIFEKSKTRYILLGAHHFI